MDVLLGRKQENKKKTKPLFVFIVMGYNVSLRIIQIDELEADKETAVL